MGQAEPIRVNVGQPKGVVFGYAIKQVYIKEEVVSMARWNGTLNTNALSLQMIPRLIVQPIA